MVKEEKEAFFAQYLGQFVLSVQYPDNSIVSGCEVSPYNLSELHQFKNAFLQLKPLSAIMDEDAIEVAKIISGNSDEFIIDRDEHSVIVTCGKSNVSIWYDCEILMDDNEQYPLLISQAYDFLRSRGYLIGFRNYTPEQLIEMGWV